MLNLGGSFSGFLDTLFDFINSVLSGVFDWLTALLSGITINFT